MDRHSAFVSATLASKISIVRTTIISLSGLAVNVLILVKNPKYRPIVLGSGWMTTRSVTSWPLCGAQHNGHFRTFSEHPSMSSEKGQRHGLQFCQLWQSDQPGFSTERKKETGRIERCQQPYPARLSAHAWRNGKRGAAFRASTVKSL